MLAEGGVRLMEAGVTLSGGGVTLSTGAAEGGVKLSEGGVMLNPFRLPLYFAGNPSRFSFARLRAFAVRFAFAWGRVVGSAPAGEGAGAAFCGSGGFAFANARAATGLE